MPSETAVKKRRLSVVTLSGDKANCGESKMPRLQTKRVYETPKKSDGCRILVDRVWPRGMTRERVRADVWLRGAAPSTGLRKWYAHDPARWNEFRNRYFLELDHNPGAVAVLLDAIRAGAVTLLYSATDGDRNQAVALREYLAACLGNRRIRFSHRRSSEPSAKSRRRPRPPSKR